MAGEPRALRPKFNENSLLKFGFAGGPPREYGLIAARLGITIVTVLIASHASWNILRFPEFIAEMAWFLTAFESEYAATAMPRALVFS